MKHFSKLLLIIPLLCARIHGAISFEEIFKDKVIVITGGAGFLGKGLIKAILPYKPREIRIFSRDEVKHFVCLEQFNYNPAIVSVLGDKKDYSRVLSATKGADLVIDAGAHKRIDMMENNVQECIDTNVFGTLNVFNACVENKVPKALFISTDKSASPINTYGACKFLSEKIFTNYDFKNIDTEFVVVRYGNVMHSTGSVIPFFVEKIKKGEPINLTDPRMTRFIISIEEAIDLIFNALYYGMGGEIFVKKLPALTIVDLIDVLKAKYGQESSVQITGLRPGEKIHETLINESESQRTYEFNDLYIITPSIKRQLRSDKKSPYLTEGTLLDRESFGDYSSDKCLISREKINDIFNSFGIYKKLKGEDLNESA